MFCHIVSYFLDCHIGGVFYDALIYVSYNSLDHAELLKKLATRIQDFLRKDVLFTVYPEIRKTFLGGVKDLGQITKTALLV